MRIHLDEGEINQAIKDFIEATGVPLSGKEITVHFTAGRGENGPKAQIEIVKTPVTAEEATDTSQPDNEQEAAILFVNDDEED